MITFIIPAHNEELLIGRTISALHIAAEAVNEPYEIIVVDDASTDATTTVAARCGAQVLSYSGEACPSFFGAPALPMSWIAL